MNFYTSTCFEGQDIYDNLGRTFVVSNGHKTHTLLDISTSLIQVNGRVRNSKYGNHIVQIYSTSESDISLEEFETSTEMQFKKAVTHTNRLNQYDSVDRAQLTSNNNYVRKLSDNTFVADRNRANFEIVNFKVKYNIYKTIYNVIDELQRNGYSVTDWGNGKAPTDDLAPVTKSRPNFKECFDNYCNLREGDLIFSLDYEWQTSIIEKKYPFVKQAYEILGRDKVVSMKYHQSNIKREIGKYITPANEIQIVEKIMECIALYEYIPVDKVKQKLQEIYEWLGVKRTAKSTDLNEWFETKTGKKTIKGKEAQCIAIIRQKMIIK